MFYWYETKLTVLGKEGKEFHKFSLMKKKNNNNNNTNLDLCPVLPAFAIMPHIYHIFDALWV